MTSPRSAAQIIARPAEDRPGLAIILVIGTTLMFITMDAIGKLLTQSGLEPEAIIAIRFAMVSTLVMGAVLYPYVFLAARASLRLKIT